MEYSYLRAADKKHNIPEHIEKTVLFLVDALPAAAAAAEAEDWDDKASSAKAAEEEAAAAVKAAWHVAKEAKQVRCFLNATTAFASSQVVLMLCLTEEYYCGQNAVLDSQFLCPDSKLVLVLSIVAVKVLWLIPNFFVLTTSLSLCYRCSLNSALLE